MRGDEEKIRTCRTKDLEKGEAFVDGEKGSLLTL